MRKNEEKEAPWQPKPAAGNNHLGLCLYRPKRGYGHDWPLYLSSGALHFGCAVSDSLRLCHGHQQMQLPGIGGKMEKPHAVEGGSDLWLRPVCGGEPAADRTCLHRCRKGRLYYRHVHRAGAHSGPVPGPQAPQSRRIQRDFGGGGAVPAQLHGRLRDQQGRPVPDGLRPGLRGADQLH